MSGSIPRASVMFGISPGSAPDSPAMKRAAVGVGTSVSPAVTSCRAWSFARRMAARPSLPTR